MLPRIKLQDNLLKNLDPAEYKKAEEFQVGLRGGIGARHARLILEASLRSNAFKYFDSISNNLAGIYSLHIFLQKILKYQYLKLEKLRQF